MPMGPETGALAPPLVQEMISLRASFSESKVELPAALERRQRAERARLGEGDTAEAMRMPVAPCGKRSVVPGSRRVLVRQAAAAATASSVRAGCARDATRPCRLHRACG